MTITTGPRLVTNIRPPVLWQDVADGGEHGDLRVSGMGLLEFRLFLKFVRLQGAGFAANLATQPPSIRHPLRQFMSNDLWLRLWLRDA